MYKISIVIPIYNKKEYIAECLDSIIAQTIEDCIEIICVDDGSTDGSADYIKSHYSDKNIRIISQENKGPGCARNTGILAASGKYIMFIDPDDFYGDTYALEYIYNAIEESGADICTGNEKRLINGRLVSGFEKERKLLEYRYEGMVNPEDFQFPFAHCLSAFSKSFLMENEIFYPELRRAEDIVFCTKAIMAARKICHVDKDVFVYRFGYKNEPVNTSAAFDFGTGWKTVLEMVADDNRWHGFARVASNELRRIAVKSWYKQLDYTDSWHIVDDINILLEKCRCKKLLSKDEWKKKGGAYIGEWLSMGIVWLRIKLVRTCSYLLAGGNGHK